MDFKETIMNRVVLTSANFEDVSLQIEDGAYIQSMIEGNRTKREASIFENLKSFLVDGGQHIVNDILGSTKKD